MKILKIHYYSRRLLPYTSLLFKFIPYNVIFIHSANLAPVLDSDTDSSSSMRGREPGALSDCGDVTHRSQRSPEWLISGTSHRLSLECMFMFYSLNLFNKTSSISYEEG